MVSEGTSGTRKTAQAKRNQSQLLLPAGLHRPVNIYSILIRVVSREVAQPRLFFGTPGITSTRPSGSFPFARCLLGSIRFAFKGFLISFL